MPIPALWKQKHEDHGFKDKTAKYGVPGPSQLHRNTLSPNLTWSIKLPSYKRYLIIAEKQGKCNSLWKSVSGESWVWEYVSGKSFSPICPFPVSQASVASPSCLQCIFISNSHWTKASSQPRIQQACCHCCAGPLETEPSQGFPAFASHLWFSFKVVLPLLPAFQNWLYFASWVLFLISQHSRISFLTFKFYMLSKIRVCFKQSLVNNF